MCKFQKVDQNISLSLWLALFTLTVCIVTIMVLCTQIHVGKFLMVGISSDSQGYFWWRQIG